MHCELSLKLDLKDIIDNDCGFGNESVYNL